MADKEKNQMAEVELLHKRIAELEKNIEKLERLNAHYEEMGKISEARAYAENILEAVKDPLIIMDGELRVFSANMSFYKTFKVLPKETEGEFIYDLGNRQWDIPDLRKLLSEIVTAKNSLDDYEITHEFETIGRKVMLLSARRVPPTPEKPRIILLAIEDITERRRMEGMEKEKNAQLDEINKKLKDKVTELEQFNAVTIDRELRMVALKKENQDLRDKQK